MYNIERHFGQAPLRSPSVFNFFKPDYAQPGAIQDLGLVSPEFQINTETAVMKLANFYFQTLVAQPPPGYASSTPYRIDVSSLLPLASNPAALVDRISDDLLGKPLPADVRQLIIDRITFVGQWAQGKPWVARQGIPTRQVTEALYLILTSPQYLIQQ